MARHKSAEKRARQSENRAARNAAVKSRVRSEVRAFREALASGDKKKAELALGSAARELRKAASRGVLHVRNASRRVSRLVLALNHTAAK